MNMMKKWPNFMWFWVPGKPVGKERARKGKHGNMYTPQRTRAYEEEVGYLAGEGISGPTRKAVKLVIDWYRGGDDEGVSVGVIPIGDVEYKPGRRPDLSNVFKAIEDGMNKIAYDDDKQVVEIQARLHEQK